MTTSGKKPTRAQLERENTLLRRHLRDVAFWARRYASGRTSYVTMDVNLALTYCRSIGLVVQDDRTLPDPSFATDGALGRWDPEQRRFVQRTARDESSPF